PVKKRELFQRDLEEWVRKNAVTKGYGLSEYCELFETSPNMLTIFGKEGRFRMVNRSFLQKLGYRKEEMLGIPFTEFIHPEDRSATLREFENIISGGGSIQNFRNRYRKKDGTYIALNWNATIYKERIYGTSYDADMEYLFRQENEKLTRDLIQRNKDL